MHSHQLAKSKSLRDLGFSLDAQKENADKDGQYRYRHWAETCRRLQDDEVITGDKMLDAVSWEIFASRRSTFPLVC